VIVCGVSEPLELLPNEICLEIESTFVSSGEE